MGAEGTLYARRHTPMYRMHKYWSRKPYNIVSRYVQKYTSAGDIVLDPFCGSGVTAIESIRSGRRVVAYDINPMSIFITRTTLEPVSLPRLRWERQRIEDDVRESISSMFQTRCELCQLTATIAHVVWRKESNGYSPMEIRYICDCSSKMKSKRLDKEDIQLIEDIDQTPVPYWYPRNIRLPTFRRESFELVEDLFTRRNLIALSRILHSIEDAGDARTIDTLRLAFSASLAQNSRMKMITKGKLQSSKGWIAPRFYVPSVHLEVNPLRTFLNSFRKIYSGKTETNRELKSFRPASSFDEILIGDNTALISCQSATDLSELPDGSVDYVFTDPPYADTIQFMSLSFFWGAWLRMTFDWEKEVIIDPTRGKDRETYYSDLQTCFSELHRVLKPRKHGTITYHPRRGQFWNRLCAIATREGFRLKTVAYQPPSSSFGPIIRNSSKSFVGDIFVGLQKHNGDSTLLSPLSKQSFQTRVVEMAEDVCRDFGRPLSTLELSVALYERFSEAEILMAESLRIDDVLKRLADGRIAWVPEKKVWCLPDLSEQTSTGLASDLRQEVSDIVDTVGSDYLNVFHVMQALYSRRKGRGFPGPEEIEHIRSILRENAQMGKGSTPRAKIVAYLAELGSQEGFRVLTGNHWAVLEGNEEYVSDKISQAVRSKHVREILSAFSGSFDVLWAKGGTIVCQFFVGEKGLSDTALHMSTEAMEKSPFERLIVMPAYSRRLGEIMKAGDFTREWGPFGVLFEHELLDYLSRELPSQEISLAKIIAEKHASFEKRASMHGRVARPKTLRTQILSNKEVQPGYFRMVLDASDLEKVSPGQFVNVMCSSVKGVAGKGMDRYREIEEDCLSQSLESLRGKPLLRRPLSVHSIYYEGFERKELKEKNPLPRGFRHLIHRPRTKIDILYKVIGTGTEYLSKLKEGNEIDILAPLGRGVEFPENLETAILVGGGIGVAPLMALAERLKYLEKEVIAVVGGIDEKSIPLGIRDSAVARSFCGLETRFFVEDFEEIGVQTLVFTEKPSGKDYVGEKGLATHGLLSLLQSQEFGQDGTIIYSCGPSPMMKEVARIAAEFGIPSYVFLEERMGCGYGICLSCACKCRNKSTGELEVRHVCIDGPLFKSDEVVFDEEWEFHA